MGCCVVALSICASMILPELPFLEKELKNRWNYPYRWFRKQNDTWDQHTNFIYQTPDWETLLQKTRVLYETHNFDKQQIFQYAANRWYNFWSAQAVEQIFSNCGSIIRAGNPKDTEKDFYLFGIPFDHKTSVFPKLFNKSFQYAKDHKAELIAWLYKNQSTQKRHHFKNRLFVVVYAENGEHWKLKAEIGLLENAIQKYLATFRPEQLQSFTFVDGQQTLSDIIWVSK